MRKIGDCAFAEDALYAVDLGVWARVADGVATVGIDTAQAWHGGAFTAVTFKAVGTRVRRGESLGSIEGPRHFDTVKTPLSGRIIAVNERLQATPGLLNHDPYGDGWFAKLELAAPDEAGSLLRFVPARPLLARRIQDLGVRCFAEFPDYEMIEIGSECSAILGKLDELLEGAPPMSVVHLVSDDPTAEVELVGWGERTGHELLESRTEGNLRHFIVKKAG
jgi:glycine cleavage system H lipoate-binding protein/TusA-related sulfurtransferase